MTVAPLTTPERLSQTHELLAHLAEAKANHPRQENEGASEYRRRLLHDPEISGLVNQIILINEPWIRHCITKERRRRGLRDSTDELMSKVVTGGYADTAEVGGVLAGILGFDLDRYSVHAFPKYLERTIHNEFEFTAKEKRQHAEVGARMQSLTGANEETAGNTARWIDHRQESPPARVAAKELAVAIQDAIRFLPAARKPVAEMMVRGMLENGEWPTHEDVGQMLGVTKERGRQLGNDTLERLRQVIKEHYPQLAAGEEIMAEKEGRRR